MSEPKKVDPIPLVFSVASMIFSFIGAILAFFTDFGWWNVGYSWSYYFFIGSEMAPAWAQFFLFLFGFLFLLLLLLSILKLIGSLGKISDKIDKIVIFGGIGLSAVTFIYNLLLVGIFASFAAGDWWGMSTSFYGGLVGPIIIGIFFVVQLVYKNKGSKGKVSYNFH
ncbi:MAG: hypothetical protein K9W42_03900 [Candidatus Heimdallarchaeota archaeon]|nr:hypothetical protein [Candidatus Heimdallarchaeota archaeon]